MGVDIINASLGGMNPTFKVLEFAIQYAESKGVLFVAASGNGDPQTGLGLDLAFPGNDVYPAELEFDSLIAVAATNEFDGLTSYSNFGKDQVHVAAPGGSSTVPAVSLATINTRGIFFLPSAGTSMAAPVVAGLSALIMEKKETLSASEVIDVLIQTGRPSPLLTEKVISEKVVNAMSALESL